MSLLQSPPPPALKHLLNPCTLKYAPPLPATERSVLQALHGCCERAVKAAVIPGSGLEWAQHYHQHVESDRFCLNEWEALNDLESVRKDSEGQR